MIERPKCDYCGQFIPWTHAIVELETRQNMSGEYYQYEVLCGTCNKCKRRNDAE